MLIYKPVKKKTNFENIFLVTFREIGLRNTRQFSLCQLLDVMTSRLMSKQSHIMKIHCKGLHVKDLSYAQLIWNFVRHCFVIFLGQWSVFVLKTTMYVILLEVIIWAAYWSISACRRWLGICFQLIFMAICENDWFLQGQFWNILIELKHTESYKGNMEQLIGLIRCLTRI